MIVVSDSGQCCGGGGGQVAVTQTPASPDGPCHLVDTGHLTSAPPGWGDAGKTLLGALGGRGGGPQCHLTILKNGNVLCSYF